MKYLLLFLYFVFPWAAEVLVEVPVLAVGTIRGRDYAISPTKLYQKTDVFRPVYALPETITAAQFLPESIQTPRYTLVLDKRISVIEKNSKVIPGLHNVEVAIPVEVLATVNNTLLVQSQGLRLVMRYGQYWRFVPVEEMSADQLESFRLAYLEQKKNMLTSVDKKYIKFLYRKETEKRREGPRDEYPVTLP
jgi:hypothetical protein